MTEIDRSTVRRQCLGAGIQDRPHLDCEIALWQAEPNRWRCAVDWRLTSADARIRLGRFYPSIHL